MAVRDLLIGEDPKAVERIQDSPLPTEPQIGIMDQLSVAIDKPSVTGGALARWAMDKVDGSRDYSPEELARMYPDAPEGTFTSRNTKRMGDWLNKRAMNEDLYSNMNKVRSMGHGSTYNAITDVGYGIVQETSPTDILLGVASGGIVSAASAGAGAALRAGSMNLGLRGLSYLGQNTTKAIIASEMVEGLVTLPIDYAVRKGLEPYTQEQESFTDAVLGTIGGAAVSAGLRATGRQLAKRFSKIHERMDPATRQAFGNALEEELNAMTEPGTNWEMMGKFSELEPLRKLNVDDRLRYKVYSAAEAIPRSMDELEGGGFYALYNQSSSMSHNGAASPFGQSVHLADNAGDLKAYSASVKQSGAVVKLDPAEFNILNMTALEETSKEAVAIKQILSDAGVEAPTLKEGFDILRKMDEQGDLIEFEVQEYLKQSGYEGITLNENYSLLDKTFSKNNTFIFDGIEGKSRKIIEQLDGSLAGLPESTAFFQNTKGNALRNGEGIMTNGKQIKLDPQGYFNTDPFYGNPEKGLTYVEYFDADQIAEINAKVETGYPKALKKKYQGLSDDLIEHVRQLNIMKEFEDASMIEADIQKLPAEWELVMKDILDTETEIALVEKLMIDRGNYEANKELIQKTVEQQAKEGKAARLLEKMDFDKITKKFVDRVEKRIGTPRESQTESIIQHYNDLVEKMKQNNPEIVDELIKATDFCLRKYTK